MARCAPPHAIRAVLTVFGAYLSALYGTHDWFRVLIPAAVLGLGAAGICVAVRAGRPAFHRPKLVLYRPGGFALVRQGES
ncbi:hypothetical protein BCF44_107403 [Kutzneria buriramensis]|uniref:Uncharacterized protein n=1 Tax=Kutzneria buriramensis TaxID=1045776 RepID=A0A3E0HIU4_9PSEU|nr:hypothetical protein BCF44_107403 [Kutzneria buriramensis]